MFNLEFVFMKKKVCICILKIDDRFGILIYLIYDINFLYLYMYIF